MPFDELMIKYNFPTFEKNGGVAVVFVCVVVVFKVCILTFMDGNCCIGRQVQKLLHHTFLTECNHFALRSHLSYKYICYMTGENPVS